MISTDREKPVSKMLIRFAVDCLELSAVTKSLS